MNTDERGKYFAFFRNGKEVTSVFRVYQDVLDRVTPIQRGMVFLNSWRAAKDFCTTPDQVERLMIATYAMCHTINDDPKRLS